MESITQIQSRVRQTSSILEKVGKNFNVNGIANQIISLTKIIQEQESIILKSKERIASWMEDAIKMREIGDNGGFDAIQKDISSETNRLKTLEEETKKYKDALSEIKALSGQGTGVSAPMFFSNQGDYENYLSLLEKREEIQSKIANLDTEGMTDSQEVARIVELRSQLTVLNTEINKTEISAAEAAKAIGTNGEKASEAAMQYYELGKAVEEQIAKINELQLKLNKASENLVTAVNDNDVEGARDAQVEYDSLTESLHSAKMELINLQTEQKAAETAFRQFGDPASNIRMQLREITMELTSLTIQYRQMSSEEKNSDAGRGIRDRMVDLAEKAGELKDTLSDVNKEISSFSSDKRAGEALAGGVNVITSTIGAATGVMAMFGVEEKNLLDIQAKLQASLAISNALTVVQTNLQRESALMTGISTVQKKASSIAENLETAAKGKNVITTIAATAAQKAFNLVAKANPYVLLATAILTVVGALAAFSIGSKKATEEEESRKKKIEEIKEREKEYADSVGSSFSRLMGTYSSLQEQWKNLKTSHEKNGWIKNNESKFNELGVSINGVDQAEKFLMQDTSNVVKSFELRAKAAASAAMAVDTYKKMMSMEISFEQEYNKKKVSAYDKVKQGDYSILNYDKSTGTYNDGKYKMNQKGELYYTEKGALDKNTEIAKSIEATDQFSDYANYREMAADFAKQEYEYTQQAQQLISGYSNNSKSGGNTTSSAIQDGNAKTIQEQRKYEEQMTELTKKAQRAREDAAIAAIQNDGERERKEREVQHQRTIEDLQKQSEEIYKTIYNQRKSAYETANKDKKYENTAEGQAGYSSDEARQAMKASFTEDEKKQFDTNQAYYRAETDKTNSEYARATLERQKSEIQAMQEYLKQYGDYEQKRLAVTKEYEEKIRNAKTEGEKLSLQKEQENALSNINFEQIKQSMNWEEIFSNLANYESQYLAHLREELRDALNVSDITAENARIITDKINEISALIEQKKNALGKLFGQGGIMSGSWLGSVFETKSNLSQLESKAQADRQKADSANTAANVAKFNKQYLDSSLLNALKEKGYNFQNVSDEGVMGAAQSAGLIEQYNEAIQAGTKATEAATAASSASATAGSSAMAAMGSKAAGSFAIVDAIIHGVNDNLQSANKAVQEWGIGGKDFQEKFSTFAESSQYATDAFDSLKKGDIAGVVYNLGNAFSTLGESVGLWSNSNISDKIAEFNEMANALNVNTQALNKLTAKIGEGDAVNAFRNYEQAKEQMKANESITADMLYNLVKRYDGHHSTDYNFYDDYNGKNIISRINRILGTKFENLYDIFHGDATILNRLYDTEEGRQVLTDFTNALRLAEEDAEMTGNDIVGNFISMLNDYSSDAYDELHKSFQEAVTGISFDSFKDGFKSMLMDMDSDVDDFKDDFTKKLMQSVLNAHIEKLFGSQLSDLYDKWTNALDDNNLTQQEVEELQSVQDDLVAQMIAERDMLAKVTGYDTTTSQDQSAASKAADKVTYDQMDEFTGILRAIQIAGEHRSDNSDIILNTLLTMQTISTGCLSSVNDIKLLVGTSNDYLLDIKRSNRQILESMNDRIDKITNIIDTKL